MKALSADDLRKKFYKYTQSWDSASFKEEVTTLRNKVNRDEKAATSILYSLEWIAAGNIRETAEIKANLRTILELDLNEPEQVSTTR